MTNELPPIHGEIESRVLEVIRGLLVELDSQHGLRTLCKDSLLVRELGLGSLEQVELLDRLEKAFRTQLPIEAYQEARTPAELASLLAKEPREPVLPGPSVPGEPHRPVVASPGDAARRFDPIPAQTLVEVLVGHATADPQRLHVQLYLEDESLRPLSYAQLLSGAARIARRLVDRGLRRGQTVAIMLPTGAEFFFSFLGVLLAGGVPVPIYPPLRLERLEEYAGRQSRSLDNAQVSLLITFQQTEKLAKLLRPAIPSLAAVVNVDEFKLSEVALSTPVEDLDAMPITPAKAEDIALIQYTSGSTGNPKGVVLTHANVLANIRAIGAGVSVQSNDRAVSWLPLYHDMGLIGSWLGALYFGIPICIMSPLSFLSRPERWLWAIHYQRATLSPAPNFAYEICTRRIEDRALEGLDLSCWRAALNGAEPVSPGTLARFTERFSRYGFSGNAFLPVYGLAESSVALTFPPLGRGPRIDRIQRERFQAEGLAQPCELPESSTLRFVSVGRPLPDHEIRVVNEAGQFVKERHQGNIQFRGPSTMQGYFRNPTATQAVLQEGWVKTGDLGYLADGELFVTGRVKDLIIKGGRNLYPQEIEEITAGIQGIRRGCVAAFGVNDAVLGTERLVIVAETREEKEERQQELINAVIAKVETQIGLPPDRVILVPPQTVPKTSSGKIRRDACKQMFLAHQLLKPPVPLWWQVMRLMSRNLIQRIPSGARRCVEMGFGIYAWGSAILILCIGWAITLILPPYPKSRIPRKLCRQMCRTVLRVTGLWPSVKGMEYLTTAMQQSGEGQFSFLAASNHASYVDALVVAAICPFEIGFVIKEEAATWPMVGRIIRKCGYLLVNRSEALRAATDGVQIALELKEGQLLHVFPEGTFTPEPGLRPFQMGGFKAAVEVKSPILPFVLKGTRSVWRDGTWLLRPGSVEVNIRPLIWPQGQGWAEMVRLRDEVRREILSWCGEQPIEITLAGPPKDE